MKIAIVAKGGTSALAPWQDEEWEIWGMPWISYPRVTRLFDVHEDSERRGTEDDRAWDDAWKAKAFPMYSGVPYYAPESRKYISDSFVELPVDDIKAAFPRAFLENSLAYMIAFAIMQQPEEIGLFGVHMVGGDFVGERASVLYWSGFVEGRGIKLTVPPGSPLFMSIWEQGRYGVSRAMRTFSPSMGALQRSV